MATQTTKIIDITRSFVPVDPNAFPDNMSATTREDFPEQKKPVMCYVGYNFLPTPYGYKSFFGINSKFEADALESQADELFIVQTNTFENILVALCEDGIWTKQGDSSGAWVQAITLEAPVEGSHLDWTYCIIGNDLFCYRATEAQYYRYSTSPTYFTPGQLPSGVLGLNAVFTAGGGTLPNGTYNYQVAYFSAAGELSLPTAIDAAVVTSAGHNTITWSQLPAAAENGYRLYVTVGPNSFYVDVPDSVAPTFVHADLADIAIAVDLPDTTPQVQYDAYEFFGVTPTFLNMDGQQGIFKAGSRLGFWDSENSTAWSSIDDYRDFKPSVTTLAGAAIFQEITGRITMIYGSADGFVIYSTKSIVHIGRNLQATFGWNPTVIVKGTGIAFKRECCAASPDTTQFAYTPTGLMQIEGSTGEYIVPEVTDYLRESDDPIYLRILEGRFLFLEILDSEYIEGLVTFKDVIVPPVAYDFSIDYLEGNQPGQQDAIEEARIDLGLPPRGVGQRFNSSLEGYRHDVQQIVPISEMLPLVTGATITDTILGKPAGYISGLIGGLSATYASLGTDRALVDTEAVATNSSHEKSSELKYIFDLSAGADNSGIVSNVEHADPFFAEQRRIWRARDQEVTDFIGYMNLYSSSKIINQSGQLKLDGNDFGADFDYTADNIYLPRVAYTVLGDNDSYEIFLGFVSNASEPINFPFGSLQTGFSTPTVRVENNIMYLRRQLLTVTAFSSTLSFTADNEVVVPEEVPGQGDSYMYTMHANTSVTAFSGSAEELFPEPIYEESSVALTGYSYIDINGDLQFIPYDAVDWEFPELEEREYPDIPDLILPGSSFLLQEGSIGPIYPTIAGALVYDMRLKKWGKMKQDYKLLLDYSPINNTSGGIIESSTFGIKGGILQTDGIISIFDKFPVDSSLTYGKIGYWRQGFTSLQEIRMTFRDYSSGQIIAEGSLNGSTIDSSLTRIYSFNNALQADACPYTSGRWHNITIKGIFDIKHLEYRGYAAGNR